MEVQSRSNLDNYQMAYQVVQAALSNPSTTQNAFLNSAQMDDMQKAYIRGTKMFIISDGARCFMVPVATLTDSETSLISQAFANCISQ